MDDVESCAGIIAACGRPPEFKVMVDRTAHKTGVVWDYATGLAAAKALQEAGVYWLEEPFARDDFETPARLCREVDITITGGEGWHGLDPFREGLALIVAVAGATEIPTDLMRPSPAPAWHTDVLVRAHSAF